MALRDNAQLLFIGPSTTAPRVNNAKNFNTAGVLVVVHKDTTYNSFSHHRKTAPAGGIRPNALMPERETMPSTARCSTPPPAALLIAMLWLTGCEMVGSDTQSPCPPVVEYTGAEQARAANEVEALPEGAVIARMLGDYAVLRDQARVCQK
ncbi:hypothetical protein GCM10007291_38130 [Gemmobacter nanjingensis]|uniref:Uncharacterized protein n=1 Tax=Gemmobacter nanjingensis TaxID=488454 RepID=A0ABQ3FQ76_9RHOB|nr:hypothetical protein GCM10007291_38130 [Gemmobacter nanjingensis]